MKKILLLSGISAIGFAALAADVPEPVKLNNVYIQAISPNGKYAVSNTSTNELVIIDLESGKKYSYTSESDDDGFYSGIGSCLSNNGILVGGRSMSSAEYWKDDQWYPLDVPGTMGFSNTANAITPDGSRICGMIGVHGLSLDGDNLMVVPCIWNAEGDGFGKYVQLPYPETDFEGRLPQYIKAIDISGDGKTVIGMITDAVGWINYPILYFEDENGSWRYEIPHLELLVPEGTEFPKYPGDFNVMMPSEEDYMTVAELDAYNEALQEYYDSGYTLPYPQYKDYMSEDELEEFNEALAEYNVKYYAWEEKYDAWSEVFNEILDYYPNYENNSVRISNDGLTYGCSIAKRDPLSWGPRGTKYNTWVFEINSDKIYKYDQQDNLSLTYLANGGVAVASSPVSFDSLDNSFVLKDGEVTGMYDWMNSKSPEYASWMKQNMEFEYWGYDEETWDQILKKEFATGHAVSNPDLSVMALSVLNIGFDEGDDVWEDPDYEQAIGYGFIFNLNAGSAVNLVRPAAEGKVIYDLSGRQLKEVSAPGIYIINGEKKVIR